MNLDFIKFNEQIFIRGNLYRKSNLDRIHDENEKLGVRLHNTTPFIHPKKMDREFKTEHKKLVEKIRKNLKGVPDYLPLIKDYAKTHTKQGKLKKNQSDGNIKSPKSTNKNDNSNVQPIKDEENKEENKEEENKEEENKSKNPDDLFKTAIKV